MTKILDCTLRDGGYYNKWDFDVEVVNSYLNAMSRAGVDYVELGLRNFPMSGFVGAFAYTTESFLNRLDLPDGPTYGVMVDAKTILNAKVTVQEAIDSLFVNATESKIGLVRVAAHFHEVEQSGPVIKALKAKGYTVGYNLMQAGGKPSSVISEKAALATDWECLDVLYFADSLGNMGAEEVKRITAALKQGWSGALGIHTHNNMGKALDNALIANSEGVEWLDVTVTGMGRGAGNAQTECLLASVSKSSTKYRPTPVYDLAIRHFEPMQRSYGWGTNLLYFLGAQHDIHPTYIQNLLSDTHYGTDEVVGAIEYLSKLENTSSYKGEVLKAALTFDSSKKEVSGSNALVGKAVNRDILILANGPSFQRYSHEIEAFIESNNPIVLAINMLPLNKDYIDYYCITHNPKFLSEHSNYSEIGKPVILPKHRFTDDELAVFGEDVMLFDYGLIELAQTYEVFDNKCTIPFDITAGYTLAIATVMKPNTILLAGFDGYASTDPRQLEMIDLLARVQKFEGVPQILSLTPTSYSVPEGSVYAPIK
ncbi:pyruvate carboxyltransferase [Alteromonas sp. BMJM2]|uniref:pyruvate carboxyltransferase n=1 Tax=Alteromonas sp. BMJM2 TaxID=2954241 RepID=UPI0022B5E009|nr:pyruvate carboxyltransferase [Alteromonas sp. BMJM2]